MSLLGLFLACDRPGEPATESDTPVTGNSVPAPDGPAGRYFPAGAPWTEVVTGAAVDGDSEALIAHLQSVGWGLGRFQMEPSLDVLTATADTPHRDFLPVGGFYDPDCDAVPVPIPDGGHVEGEAGYACENDGDCHLLVVDDEARTLWEMWRADLRGDVFEGGCLAVWDLDRVYPPEGRGEQCTSADAAGYPIAPLLATADEVATGEVAHALRFILPNDRIRDGEYVHPATHATNADGGGAESLPYGARLRLRADFDLGRIADVDAWPLVVALQTYGMFLADGGNVVLTVQSDVGTTAKWDELFEEGTHALVGIEPEDFEVLELGPSIPLTFDCVRNGY